MSIRSHSREEIQHWLERFHHAADSLSTADLPKFYSKNATLVFANNEPVVGLENVLAHFGSTFPLIARMKHELIDFEKVKDTIYLKVRISYTVANDPKNENFEIPAMGVCHMVELEDREKGEGEVGLFTDRFEVYLDMGPVAKRMQEVAQVGKGKGEEGRV